MSASEQFSWTNPYSIQGAVIGEVRTEYSLVGWPEFGSDGQIELGCLPGGGLSGLFSTGETPAPCQCSKQKRGEDC